jgi:hypothetical protein
MSENTIAIWGILAVLFTIVIVMGLLQELELKKAKNTNIKSKRMKIKSLKYRVK